MRNLTIILTLIVGIVLGSLGTTLRAGERGEKYPTAYDSNGQQIHIGDVIVGANGVPIKVHGFTATYRAGTFAAYSNQVRICPNCAWVETAPEEVAQQSPAPATGAWAALANLFSTDVFAQKGGGDCIVWGS